MICCCVQFMCTRAHACYSGPLGNAATSYTAARIEFTAAHRRTVLCRGLRERLLKGKETSESPCDTRPKRTPKPCLPVSTKSCSAYSQGIAGLNRYSGSASQLIVLKSCSQGCAAPARHLALVLSSLLAPPISPTRPPARQAAVGCVDGCSLSGAGCVPCQAAARSLGNA